MKTFEKSFIKKKPLRKASAKAQSAMEYLMTYGWAILIVAVVLGALYSLGVFNGAAFLGTSCIAASGFYCTNPTLSTGGVLTVTIGQATGTTFKNAYLYFVPSGTDFSTSDPSTSIGALNSGQQVTVSIPLGVGSPYPAAYTLGTPLSGYLYLQFTDIYGTTEVNNIATVLTKVIATGSGGATTPTSTTTTLTTTTSLTSTTTTLTTTTSLTSTTTTLTTTTSTSTTTTTNPIQYIYCVGTGASPNKYVYYAPVSSTGIGAWTSTTSYPIPMFDAGCSIYNGYIYCVGTGGDSPYTQVYYSPISSTGIGAWTSTTSYPVPMNGAGCSIYNGYIYCVGTGAASLYVYYAPVSSTGIGAWTSTTSYPIPMIYAGCSIYNGYIYCVGTGAIFQSPQSPYTQVYYAPISSTGIGAQASDVPVSSTGIGTWQATTSYPVAMYQGTAGASPYNQEVYYASVSSTGIGAWQATTSYPVAMYAAGCSIYNGYIYCVGPGVYYAPVSSTGIGAWQATTSYPVTMENAGCSIYNGYIYCVGTYGTSPYTQVYYAPISSTGIGAWTSTTSYPVEMKSAYCEIPGSGGGYLGGGGPN